MMSDDVYGILIHEYAKSPTRRVRFHIQEYRGTDYLDIREFYLDNEDAWRPTKKGITVRPHLYAEFLHGVVQSADHLGGDASQLLQGDDP